MDGPMAEYIVVFKHDKTTKNKIRFTATGEVSGSIYVDKDSKFLNGTGEIWLKIKELGD